LRHKEIDMLWHTFRNGTGRRPGGNGTQTLPGPPPQAERVCRQHALHVYRLAGRLLRDAADVEEVTREVLRQLLGRFDAFRQEADAIPWLHRTTVNAALCHRRGVAARGRLRELAGHGGGR
jgi:DNA-directed RNA polymerase specialized sigma24 family protein